MTANKLFVVFDLVTVCFIFYACGSKAGGYRHAESIPGPSGVSCFAVIDENNAVVGGNCR